MCLCSLEFILETIGKKWVLLIINEIGSHKKLRYNDLKSKFGEISPSTLSSSLRILENIDLLKRKTFEEIPPRVEYSLSKEGKEFQELLEPLIEWAKNYDSLHCKCNQNEQSSHHIGETSQKSLNRIVEASLCACTCLAIMTANYLMTTRIF